jgi:hypothetical protein
MVKDGEIGEKDGDIFSTHKTISTKIEEDAFHYFFSY